MTTALRREAFSITTMNAAARPPSRGRLRKDGGRKSSVAPLLMLVLLVGCSIATCSLASPHSRHSAAFHQQPFSHSPHTISRIRRRGGSGNGMSISGESPRTITTATGDRSPTSITTSTTTFVRPPSSSSEKISTMGMSKWLGKCGVVLANVLLPLLSITTPPSSAALAALPMSAAAADAATDRVLERGWKGQSYSEFMANEQDVDKIVQLNHKFAEQVWSTVHMSYYDPTGGSRLGPADPKWEAVWREAQKRGVRQGAFQTAEGTRGVLRYMMTQLRDDYSTYLSPAEVRAQFATTGAEMRQDVNEADGGSSLSGSVGMQLEPATYCPSTTSLQPTFNSETATYDYPWVTDPSTTTVWRNLRSMLRPPPPPSSPSSPPPVISMMMKDSYYTRRPCAVVAGVLPGSPAEEAGIKLGDRVSKIGRVVTENAAVWDTMDGEFENTLLKGMEGSTIKVEVVRQDREDRKPEPITLRRRSFRSGKYPALRTSELIDDQGNRIAYIRLHKFDHAATSQLASVLAAEEATGVTSYVVDLRNNMGGIFQDALMAASLFLPGQQDVLCYTLDSWGSYQPHFVRDYPITTTTSPPPPLPSPPFLFPSTTTSLVPAYKPVVLLINRGTASSAEAFAAALHDNHRAVLLGERSFGKSLIQHVFPLPDGGALKLTVAEYLTPNKRHLFRVRLPGPRGRSKSLLTYNGGLDPDLALRDSAPRPNSMDDKAIATALDVLALRLDGMPMARSVRMVATKASPSSPSSSSTAATTTTTFHH